LIVIVIKQNDTFNIQYMYLSCVPGADGKIHSESVLQHRRWRGLLDARTHARYSFLHILYHLFVWCLKQKTTKPSKKNTILYKSSAQKIVTSSHATRLTWGCKMTFSSTGSWCGNPCPICKNKFILHHPPPPPVRRVACDGVMISRALLLYKIAFILQGSDRKQ